MTNKLAGLLGKKPSTQPTEKSDEEAKAETPVSNAGSDAEATPSSPKPATKLGGLRVATVPVAAGRKAAPTQQSSAPAKDSALTLDDLSESEDPGTFRPSFSPFPDETPADMPLRDLEKASEGADDETRKGMAQFAQLIDGVYSILDDPEMLSNVIRSIMIELKANPQYMKLVVDDDIRVWIRAMRENMGLQKIAKEAKKTSRGKGTSAHVDMDMLADLEAFGSLD